MEVTPTLDDAEALRQLMLADEHLMICLCGVDEEHDEDARALQEAVQKIVRIKKQMGGNFTKDVDTLVAAVPGLLTSAERQATSSFRLLLVYRQVKKSPSLHASQSEVAQAFIKDPVCHLDVIYWHQDVPVEAAQNVFNQFCAYDNTNLFAKFYFLEVGQSLERLHQVRFGSCLLKLTIRIERHARLPAETSISNN
ncbi:Striatin-interacting protein 1 [Phytophthora nicotianae]|uniref:Striatin-interacting protein 1 n=1 Tax=Phytophthora nicotianae TaxID=4792 RepID=A0A0W8DR80_PHYNI|nr:Striatin-interacting protein 1 [Phytophthora nicotianae]